MSRSFSLMNIDLSDRMIRLNQNRDIDTPENPVVINHASQFYHTTFRPQRSAVICGRPHPSNYMRDALNEVVGRDYVQTILEGFLRSKVTHEAVVEEVEWFGRLCPGGIVVDDEMWKKAVDITRAMFRLKDKACPYHYRELFDNQELRSRMPLSHSPGLPFTQDGTAKTKEEAMKIIEHSMRSRLHTCKTQKTSLFLHPVKISVRNHMINQGGGEKVRGIYAYPTDAWMVEAMLYKNLIDHYNKEDTAYGINVVPILGGLNKIYIEQCKFGVDISKFDKTIATEIIEVAFDIVAENINWTRYEDGGIPDTSALLHLHTVMKDYFINTPMQTPDGGCYVKTSGVPSGTHLTNLVDSICMALPTVYLMLHFELPCDWTKCKFMGDDAYIVFRTATPPAGLDLQKYADELWSRFGQILNTVKTEVLPATETSFAGYKLTSRGGVPTRNVHALVAALLLPETPDRCADDAHSRLIGLSYAGGFNDRFLEVCAAVEKILIPQKTGETKIKRSDARFIRMLGVPLEMQGSVCTPQKFKQLLNSDPFRPLEMVELDRFDPTE